jgi:hypothetical protein
LCAADERPSQFLHMDQEEMAIVVQTVRDQVRYRTDLAAVMFSRCSSGAQVLARLRVKHSADALHCCRP